MECGSVKNINEALRLIRVFHDMSQSALANQLGKSPALISQIESGHASPSLETIEAYSRVFSLPVSSLFFFCEHISEPESARDVIFRGAIADGVIAMLQMIEKRADLDPLR